MLVWLYLLPKQKTAAEPRKSCEKRAPPPSKQPHPLHTRACKFANSTMEMALPRRSSCVLALLCALSTVRAQVVVTVDPTVGNDSNCFSAQEMNESVSITPPGPCATINRALGDVGCGRNGSCEASGRDQLSGVEIRLADGVHRLTSESSSISRLCRPAVDKS